MNLAAGCILALVLGQPVAEPPSPSALETPIRTEESGPEPQLGPVRVEYPHPVVPRRFAWEYSDWAAVPVIPFFPRAEYWGPITTGPAYYSLWDAVRGKWRETPPKIPFPRVAPLPQSFFDLDFSYLDDNRDSMERDWLDFSKRRHPTESTMVSFGGEIRLQIQNITAQFFDNLDENFLLHRVRVYGDVWWRDQGRIYLEFINAGQSWENAPTVFPDNENGDFLNAFGEWKLAEVRGQPIYIRAGRQELLYGSQRLISTLDWSNTRRTFQGVKAYHKGDNWDTDLFWVQPVIVDQFQFNSVNEAVGFAGWWNTWKSLSPWFVDLYALNLNNSDPVAVGKGLVRGSQNITTLGTRLVGEQGGWLFEGEAMIQMGRWSNQSFLAGATSIGGGYAFQQVHGIPTFQIHYDYASGSRDPFGGDSNSTFQQLFPFGHYYLGYLDLVGRQNIHDISAQFSWWANHWIQFNLQTHRFYLDTPQDALYTANGRKLRQDPTGRAGRDVGTELDLTTSFHLSNHQDFLLGWSQIWSGRFIRETGPNTNPQLFYAQYSHRW